MTLPIVKTALARCWLWIAWLMFVISLALPAVVVDTGAWTHPDDRFLPGLVCALFSPHFYLSNILMLSAPVALHWLKPKQSLRWPRLVYGATLLASGVGGLSILGTTRVVHVGYIFWIASFFVMTASIVLLDRTATNRSRLPESETDPQPGDRVS